MMIRPTILHVSERIKIKMKKVFSLIIDESNEPLIIEEDEILEDILNSLESISNRIDDIQLSLIITTPKRRGMYSP